MSKLNDIIKEEVKNIMKKKPVKEGQVNELSPRTMQNYLTVYGGGRDRYDKALNTVKKLAGGHRDNIQARELTVGKPHVNPDFDAAYNALKKADKNSANAEHGYMKKTGVSPYEQWPVDEEKVNELSPETYKKVADARRLQAQGIKQIMPRAEKQADASFKTSPVAGWADGNPAIEPAFKAGYIKHAPERILRDKAFNANQMYLAARQKQIMKGESKLAESFKNVVRNEFKLMLKEAAENSGTVESKLETLRKKFVKEGQIPSCHLGSGTNNHAARPERRVPLATVSELIEVPVNELVLYFLNGERITETEQMSETAKMFRYGMGHVYFFNDDKAGE